MADYAVGTSDDGLRYAVNRLVKDPAFIPARLEEGVKEQYFAGKLLRQGPPMPGGSIVFEESEGQFAEDDPEILEEYAEIPLTQAKRGKLHTAYGARYGRGLRISRQTVRRNNYDQLAKDMKKLRNNFARVDENRAVTALLAALGTFTGNDWTSVSASSSTDLAESVFSDVAKVVFNIKNADSDSSNGTGESKLRFNPDTIVMNPMLATKLMFNRDIINALSVGANAGRNPLLTGQAVEAFTAAFNLRPVFTDRLDVDKAMILEAGTVGFVSEEDALHFSPLEFHANTASYDTYGERTWAVAIDQPKAGLVITGVNGGSATLANFSG